jgi:hypothetical protein
MRKLILSLLILSCLSAYPQICTNMDNNIVFSNSKYAPTVYPAEAPSATAEVPGPRRVGPKPPDPYPDPIGDVTWPMLLLFGTAYLVYKNRKKIGEQH